MNNVIEKLKEIDVGEVGIAIYSTKGNKESTSLNSELTIPLASAAKVAIAYCVAKWVEDDVVDWDAIVEEVSFNPEEDSKELYPHLQNRPTLPLREAVEVMIACHDSYIARSIVEFCGGWEKVNKSIQSHYPSIHVTENPRDIDNMAKLNEMLDLMLRIYQGYKTHPLLWTPLINGLVRQKGDIMQIPVHHLNHMTGGLENAAVDIGIMGDFNDNPYIFALGAIHLPNRLNNQVPDGKIIEALELLYGEFLKQ
ncbi:class A beta-lactamase-related serine hydrolase [Rossellomorea sp. SC111]|uniref:serine hydrolase n=1 Tax=Rossellomorea sp. SC111 TaxID=2968985 RepID=UPI00215AC04C|nr:class A beta-lactamase-related serine hydrolase [Rossellomorea sp. SC111]MCR8848398.1 class A beta-lactamase-related serine hydrolase [Rossellomorea sp. SC111]